MKNQRGQALVEFVLILPVLILLFLGLFDIGNYMYERYQLTNDIDLLIDLYQEGKDEQTASYLTEHQLTLTTSKQNNLLTFRLTKKISIRTPGLSQVLKNTIEVKETIYEL